MSIRYGKPIKNKKRRDPRYFLNEHVDEDRGREEINSIYEAEGEEVMAAIKDVPDAAAAIAEKVKAEIEKMAGPSGLDPGVLAQAVAALITVD